MVMSEIVLRLSVSLLFDETKILSENRQKNISAMDKMFEHATGCIDGMKGKRSNGNQDKSLLNLLTGVSALFIPDSDVVPLSVSCSLLHLNRKSKYVSIERVQRKAFDNYLQLSGPIRLEEMVTCRGGYGRLKSSSDASVVISLEPWSCEVMYEPNDNNLLL